MNRRLILGMLAFLAVACVAAPTFGSVSIGPGSGQPVITAPLGADPSFDFTFSDPTLGLSGAGVLYASPEGGGAYIVTGGTMSVTSTEDSIFSAFDSTSYQVAIGIAQNANGDNSLATYGDQIYPSNTSPNQLDGWGLLWIASTGDAINIWGDQNANTPDGGYNPTSPGPYGIEVYGPGLPESNYGAPGGPIYYVEDAQFQISELVEGNSSSVPEPATIIIWSLLGAASWLGMGVWRQRRGPVGRQPWSPENRQAIHEIVGRRSH